MYAYQVSRKLFCESCYEKNISEAERQPGHRLDADDFFQKFQNRPQECSGCKMSIEYSMLYTTTEHSLGNYDGEGGD